MIASRRGFLGAVDETGEWAAPGGHYGKHGVTGPSGREGLGPRIAYQRSRDSGKSMACSVSEKDQRVLSKSRIVYFQFSELAYILVPVRSRLRLRT